MKQVLFVAFNVSLSLLNIKECTLSLHLMGSLLHIGEVMQEGPFVV